MGRIESSIHGHASVALEVSPEGSVSHGEPSRSAAIRWAMPPPCGSTASIAERIAALVMEMAKTQKKSGRETDAIESAAQHAAEDRQVAEMREKAAGMKTSAWAEGATIAAGGLVTLGSLKPGVCADAVRALQQFGEQVSKGSKIASGLGSAAQAGHDAAIEQQRVFAQRALRSRDDAQRGLQDAAELLTKALAFVRDAARTQADSNLASVRWG